YHDSLKLSLLGVSTEALREHGAVSGEVASLMAEGIRRVSQAEVGLATTGIAGPGGATPTKPVGLAYVAASNAQRTLVREHRWSGDRASNRRSSAEAAIQLTLELLAPEK